MTTKASKGQSLFEVVIALAISTIIIVSLVSLVSNSIRNSTFSKNKTLASRYSQEATEWLRGQRDLDTATFKTNSLIPTWCLKDLSWSIGRACNSGEEIAGTPFTREIYFVTTIVSGKTITQADVVVFWTDSQGVHEARSATNFSDWRER